MEPQELPEDLIDTTAAARLAKCHITSLNRWIHRGKLRGWRRGGRWFVSQADVLALFKPVKPQPVAHAEMLKEKRTRIVRDAALQCRLREKGLLVGKGW